jgi:carbon storage regulator
MIRVGETVTVRVLEVKGNQVRLGIEAPGDVRIYREEVYRAIRKENEEAGRSDPKAVEGVKREWDKQPDKK